ncbi:hypothetical protein MPTK1_6g01643 [Marchantia polymorpha subsp. ruderalis]
MTSRTFFSAGTSSSVGRTEREEKAREDGGMATAEAPCEDPIFGGSRSLAPALAPIAILRSERRDKARNSTSVGPTTFSHRIPSHPNLEFIVITGRGVVLTCVACPTRHLRADRTKSTRRPDA